MSRTRLARLTPLCLALGLLGGCDQSNLGQSCGGSEVLVCPPYEWAEIREASFTPDELPVGDFSMQAQIRVVLERCDDAPAAHEVGISALVPEPGADPDAGAEMLEVFNLVTLRDGADGDPVPDDGIIEVEITNPFNSGVPAERDVQLRFEAISRAPSGCGSGVLVIPYRTGPAP